MAPLTAGNNRALLPHASFVLKDSHCDQASIHYRYTEERQLASIHIYILNDECINGI